MAPKTIGSTPFLANLDHGNTTLIVFCRSVVPRHLSIIIGSSVCTIFKKLLYRAYPLTSFQHL